MRFSRRDKPTIVDGGGVLQGTHSSPCNNINREIEKERRLNGIDGLEWTPVVAERSNPS